MNARTLTPVSSRSFSVGQSYMTAKGKERLPVEKIINYLTPFVSVIAENSAEMQKLEEISMEVFTETRDPELIRIAKDHGWTGTRYASTDEESFDPDAYLRALSNYYLKKEPTSLDIQTIVPTGEMLGLIKLYCPDVLLGHLQRQRLHDCIEPHSFTFQGACMLADISGFSRFSGQMCSKGISGLDYLREETNYVLGYFVRTVKGYGGDVIAFAGDALICIFPCTFNDSTYSPVTTEEAALSEGGIEQCCFRALQCANELRTFCTDYLFTHIGISCGELSLGILGGISNQYIYLLNGACIVQLADCIHDAEKGQAAATLECYNNALAWANQLSSSPGNDVGIVTQHKEPTHHGNMLILSVSGEPVDIEIDPHEDMPIVHLHAISLFVPKPAYNALTSESREVISELREVTTLFLNLETYDPVKHRDPMTLQPFFRMCQTVLHETGGFLRQFLVDDKGCVFIAMWGTPCYAYSNNCSRALYCAAHILQNCAMSKEHEVSIGITTGVVYCGSIGSKLRKDYAGIGTDVNMAARLMCKANKKIYVDSATYQNLNQTNKNLLKPLPEPLILKGAIAPVPAYVFEPGADMPRLIMEDRQSDYHHIMLRKPVREAIVSQLDHFTNIEDGEGVGVKNVFTILHGVHGTGKSVAAHYFKHCALKRNMNCVHIVATVELMGMPYGVMKQLFLELVGRDNFVTKAQQERVVQNLVDEVYSFQPSEEKSDALSALSQILCDFNPNSEESTHHLSQMIKTPINMTPIPTVEEVMAPASAPAAVNREGSGDAADEEKKEEAEEVVVAKKAAPQRLVRAKTVKLISSVYCAVICHLLANRPFAIILENAEYFDEMTWSELRHLQTAHINVAIMITLLCDKHAHGMKSSKKSKNVMALGKSGHSLFRPSGDDDDAASVVSDTSSVGKSRSRMGGVFASFRGTPKADTSKSSLSGSADLESNVAKKKGSWKALKTAIKISAPREDDVPKSDVSKEDQKAIIAEQRAATPTQDLQQKSDASSSVSVDVSQTRSADSSPPAKSLKTKIGEKIFGSKQSMSSANSDGEGGSALPAKSLKTKIGEKIFGSKQSMSSANSDGEGGGKSRDSSKNSATNEKHQATASSSNAAIDALVEMDAVLQTLTPSPSTKKAKKSLKASFRTSKPEIPVEHDASNYSISGLDTHSEEIPERVKPKPSWKGLTAALHLNLHSESEANPDHTDGEDEPPKITSRSGSAHRASFMGSLSNLLGGSKHDIDESKEHESGEDEPPKITGRSGSAHRASFMGSLSGLLGGSKHDSYEPTASKEQESDGDVPPPIGTSDSQKKSRKGSKWGSFKLAFKGSKQNLTVNTTEDEEEPPPKITSNKKRSFRNSIKGVFGSQKKSKHKLKRSDSFSSNASDVDPRATLLAEKYGLHFKVNDACREIFEDRSTTILEMSNLDKEEVRYLLQHTLQMKELPEEIVTQVFDLSSGNPFWCKTIAISINEMGIEKILERIKGGGSNALANLVLCRMEQMSLDHQTLLKRVSLIRGNFNLKLLESISDDITDDVSDVAADFVQHGFLRVVRESLDPLQTTYCFQNDLVMSTIANLTPPRAAEGTHYRIGQSLEKLHADNLTPHFLTLAYHFRLAVRKAEAFKYTVKGANELINAGAYHDGLLNCQQAFSIGTREKEYVVLLHVVDSAIFQMENDEGSLASVTSPAASSLPPTPHSRSTPKMVDQLSKLVRKENPTLTGYRKLRREIDRKARADRMTKEYHAEPSLGFVVAVRETPNSPHGGRPLTRTITEYIREHDEIEAKKAKCKCCMVS